MLLEAIAVKFKKKKTSQEITGGAPPEMAGIPFENKSGEKLCQ